MGQLEQKLEAKRQEHLKRDELRTLKDMFANVIGHSLLDPENVTLSQTATGPRVPLRLGLELLVRGVTFGQAAVTYLHFEYGGQAATVEITVSGKVITLNQTPYEPTDAAAYGLIDKLEAALGV